MFGYSIPEQMHFVPSFTDALVQGGFLLFFVRGHHFYNSPTGTLYFESMGSFLIFALAFGVVMARKINGFVAVIFWLICMAAAWFFSPFYVAFVAGLGLSLFFSTKPIAIPPWAGLAMIVASTFFLSYEFQAGEYAFLGRLGVTPAWEFYINMAGAVMLILGVESNPKAHRWLTGRFGAFLGRLSFPIYLVHFLVLTSIGCYVWLLLIHAYGPDVAMVASIFVSVVVSVVASLPMMAFDRWWTSQVNRVAIVVMRAITGSPPLRLLQAQSPR
jgi:peptidoglycan/LPS O-acetylase OafA/YrhL